MAQTELLSMPGAAMAGSFTAEELHEIRECEKLIRFRDEVLSGAHPHIKPAHLTAKTGSTDSHASSSNALTSSARSPQAPVIHPAKAQAGATGNRQTAVNSQQPAHSNIPNPQTTLQTFSVNTSQAVPGLGSLPKGGKAMPSSTRPFVPSGSSEINPVLLEKSVELVKAEASIKRQRLERALRDEVDQRRVSAKAGGVPPAEPMAEVDPEVVLARAQALVKPLSPPPTGTDETVANASAASDSFDDNTFYSSQHNTPEFLEEESRRRNKSPEDVEMREESPYEPRYEAEPAVQPAPSQNVEPSLPQQAQSNAPLQNTSTFLPPSNIPTGPRAERMQGPEPRQNLPLPPRIPGLQTVPSSEGNGSQRTAAEVGYGAQKTVNQPPLSSVNNARLGERLDWQPSPLIRAHNLSPIAPQPAHVSPLAVARQHPSAQFDPSVRTGTPAQVAALRKQPSAASSPDSSPRDSGATEKKQKKKKKRKSERLAAAEAPAASPRIKAEPRSPSPIIAPPFARPNRRMRQEHREPAGQGHDEVRYDQPPRAEAGYAPRYEQSRTYMEDPYPPTQQTRYAEGPRPLQPSPAVVASGPRYERDYYAPALPPPPAAVYRPASPGSAFPGHYVPGQVRQVRAVSHTVVERPYRDAPAQYVEAREGRMSVRPAVDRERSRSPVAYERHGSAMPPPRAPVRRIIVDEWGREYMEPPRPQLVRASVAPGERPDEPEIIYERTVPARAVSRRPDTYEDGPLYPQPLPYAPPANAPYARRVVTQPELSGPDYRAYRERDYAPRPVVRYADEMLPPGAERRAEGPREYVARAVSVRPVGDAYQYDLPLPPGYQRRIVEEVPREHASVRAGSVRPADGLRYTEVRHGYGGVGAEYGAVPARAASVRPVEPVQYGEVVRDQGWRGGSVRPDVREYVPEAGRRDMLPPPPPPPLPRAYSVRPVEAPAPVSVRPDYQQPALRPADGYYGQGAGRGDDEVTYVGQAPRQDAYGAPRHH